MISSNPYDVQRAAVAAYMVAVRALQHHHLQRSPDGFIVDDPEEDARLTRNLVATARHRKASLEALGCPLPPRLEAEAAGLYRC